MEQNHYNFNKINDNNFLPAVSGDMANLSLPANITENTTSITIPSVALIELPQELFEPENTTRDTSSSLLYSYYTTTSLFPVRNVNGTTNLTVESFILGALIAGKNVANLMENVNITLRLNEV